MSMCKKDAIEWGSKICVFAEPIFINGKTVSMDDTSTS